MSLFIFHSHNIDIHYESQLRSLTVVLSKAKLIFISPLLICHQKRVLFLFLCICFLL